MARWHAGRGSGGSGILRKKKEGAGWALSRSGQVGWMPLGPTWRENNEESGWATRMTGPKWKIGFGFDFPNFISGIWVKNQRFQILSNKNWTEVKLGQFKINFLNIF
jgi:hypothetical protein